MEGPHNGLSLIRQCSWMIDAEFKAINTKSHKKLDVRCTIDHDLMINVNRSKGTSMGTYLMGWTKANVFGRIMVLGL